LLAEFPPPAPGEKAAGRGGAPGNFVFAVNATVTACERAGEWPAALQLLCDARDGRNGWPRPDLLTYNATISACTRGQRWQSALDLLQEARRQQLRPGAAAFSCAARACGHGGGRFQSEVWGAVAWAYEASGLRPPAPPVPVAELARKQASVLDFVRRQAPQGDLEAVLSAMRDFAQQREWLKVAGGAKARLLEAVLRPGDVVLELGCFVGFSALVAVQRLRRLGGGGRVISCELDAASAIIAREVISWAGAAEEVQVRIGLASDWIASGQLGSPDVLVLDHRGARYHEDLAAIEESLPRSARVLADNVLSPGAPLFLSAIDGRYAIAIHEVDEFMRAGPAAAGGPSAPKQLAFA
ncbi:unnamed protein product, partial [Polarella glacialis]